MTSILVIRHGLSEANNRDNIGTPAFGHADAPLMEQGQIQAAELGESLPVDYDIIPAKTPVATSYMRRAQETARFAGFRALTPYTQLNEVSQGIELANLRGAIARREPPSEAIDAAHALLEQPPVETVWVTHGLLIASLCRVLGQYQDARFIPRFCEVRRIELPSKSA